MPKTTEASGRFFFSNYFSNTNTKLVVPSIAISLQSNSSHHSERSKRSWLYVRIKFVFYFSPVFCFISSWVRRACNLSKLARGWGFRNFKRSKSSCSTSPIGRIGDNSSGAGTLVFIGKFSFENLSPNTGAQHPQLPQKLLV